MIKILNKEIKNIVLLVVSSFFSNVSNYIFDIGILIYLYDSTKSPSVISGYFISQLLPVFLLLFLGGTIDKFNKKYLVITTIVLRLFFLILILINKNMFIIYLTSFIGVPSGKRGITTLRNFETLYKPLILLRL